MKILIHIIGNQTNANKVLISLETATKIKNQINKISQQDTSCLKVYFCNGELLYNLSTYLINADWERVFQFCNDNSIVLVQDPNKFIQTRKTIDIMNLSLYLAKSFEENSFHVVFSDDLTPNVIMNNFAKRLLDSLFQIQNKNDTIIIDFSLNVIIVKSKSIPIMIDS